MSAIVVSRVVPAEVPREMRDDVELCLNRYVDLYEMGQHPYYHLPATCDASNWLPLAPAAEMANFIFHKRHLEQQLFLTPFVLAGWGEASHGPGQPYCWHFFRVSRHPICETAAWSITPLQHVVPANSVCPGCAARLVPELLKSNEPSARLAVAQVSKAVIRPRAGQQQAAPSLFETA